jgi:hypothetical protein
MLTAYGLAGEITSEAIKFRFGDAAEAYAAMMSSQTIPVV